MHRSRANYASMAGLLCGTRIVVPRLLRARVVKLAHEGHKCKVERSIGSLVKAGGRK